MNPFKSVFSNDETYTALTPAECIQKMFEGTDEEGFLCIPEWPYDDKESEDAEHFYICKMNWSEDECEMIIREYLKLESRLRASDEEKSVGQIIEENRDIVPFSRMDESLVDIHDLKNASGPAVYDVAVRAARLSRLYYLNASEIIINNEGKLLAQALVVNRFADSMELV